MFFFCFHWFSLFLGRLTFDVKIFIKIYEPIIKDYQCVIEKCFIMFVVVGVNPPSLLNKTCFRKCRLSLNLYFSCANRFFFSRLDAHVFFLCGLLSRNVSSERQQITTYPSLISSSKTASLIKSLNYLRIIVRGKANVFLF